MRFSGVSDLVEHLRSIYAPHETIYEALRKLSSVFQKSNEEVIVFANRVRELGKRILDAFKREYGTISQIFVKNTEENLRKCFLRGLKSEISVRMSSEYSEILNELISRAIIIEKENDAISQMRGSSEGRLEKRVGHSTVHKVQFEQVVCQLCDKFGHIATECWSYETVRSKGNNNSHNKSPQSSNEPDYKQIVDALLNAQQQIPFSQNRNNHRGNNNNEYRRFQENRDNNPRDTKFCRYCRKPGHNIEECRKITYNSNRESNSFSSQKLQNRSGNLRNSTMTSAPRGNLTARSARPIVGEVIESEIVE
ncbi:hypothetical protein WN55_07325 [Dufourea novaeangliae]|nr:hypothetical protein WN55_07325 [Dufourea novaeangliae]